MRTILKLIFEKAVGRWIVLAGTIIFFISGPVYEDWNLNPGHWIGIFLTGAGAVLFIVYLITPSEKRNK